VYPAVDGLHFYLPGFSKPLKLSQFPQVVLEIDNMQLLKKF
jgi:hypothetical protein